MRDELDKLIDAGLVTWSQAEPLTGLEQRVLDRVRLAEASRRRRWRWTLAAAVPALAAALFVIFAPKPNTEPLPLAVAPPPPVPVVLPEPRPATPRRIAKVRRHTAKPELPKRNLFPTISPLTGEERLLVQLAQASPQLLPDRPVDEIEIKPIQIAPLHIDGAQ